MTWLPNAFTVIGFAIGVAGAALYPTSIGLALLALSLSLDVLDGTIARALGATSELGALLDWWADVALGNLFAVVAIAHDEPILGAAIIGAMLACQAMTAALMGLPPSVICADRSTHPRVSGRAVATFLLWIWALASQPGMAS